MKLTPLYEVKLIEQNKQHYYQLGDDETWKPGVTTVLKVLDKPALIPWATKCVSDNIKEALKSRKGELTHEEIEAICDEGKNIYKKKASDAADLGSRVHGTINQIIAGIDVPLSKDIEPAVRGFLDWEASNSLKIELGDTKIGSKLFGYGGSLDMVAFDGHEAIIFDFKTTKARKGKDHGIYDEYAYQLAAYAQAFTETYGIPVKSVYALWLNKEKPEFKAVKIHDIRLCLDAFLACLKLTRINKIEKFSDDMVLV